MNRTSLAVLITTVFLCSGAFAQTNSCDLNSDGKVDSADVDLATSMALGTSPCTTNIAGTGVCNVVVVQRVVNAVLGGACVTHYVSLTWTASVSTGVVGYKVYRATTSGGPYTLLNSTPVTATTLRTYL